MSRPYYKARSISLGVTYSKGSGASLVPADTSQKRPVPHRDWTRGLPGRNQWKYLKKNARGGNRPAPIEQVIFLRGRPSRWASACCTGTGLSTGMHLG